MTAPSTPQRALRSAASTRSKPAAVKLEVVAGAHRGAVLILDRADYRIGSSPNADIVLSDPGVAPEHGVLHVEHGTVRIGATGADITVEQDLLPVSRGCRVRLPVSLALGAAQVCISDPDQDTSLRSAGLGRWVLRKPLTAGGVLACFVVGISMVAQELRLEDHAMGLAITTSSSNGIASRSAMPVTASVPSTATAYALSGPTAEDAARELNARLDAAKIQTLHVSTENGRLAVA